MVLFRNLKNSISKKLLIRVFSIYLTITLSITLFHMYQEYQYTKNSIYKEIVALEDTFKIPLSNTIWNYNIDQRDILLKNINGLSIISGVKLFSKENQLLKEYGELEEENSAVYTFKLTNNFHGYEKELGFIKLYSKHEIIFDRVKVGFFFIVINSMIKTLVLWLLFLWAFDKFLSRPLNELSEQVSKIDLDHLENNKSLRSYQLPEKPNELELFRESFSQMLTKMYHSKKQLDALNETLDEKVRIKTTELQNSLDDFKTLLNSTIEAVIIFDEQRKCIDCNDTAFEVFGFDNKEDVIGLNLLEFVHEDSIAEVKERIASKKNCQYEVKLLKKNKEVFPAIVRGRNTKVQGKDVRITAVIDISELKEKEYMLLQNTKLAAMGEMIGNIAHQWRQPLSLISTVATGMSVKKENNLLEDEEFYNSCENICETSQYLSQTIDSFTNYIKGDSTAVTFNLKNDTDSFIKIVDSSIKNYQLQVILDLEESIKLKGYPNELIQCFINIFNNAKDALVLNEIDTKERYIFISQYLQDEKVYIEFKDNAGGVPLDILPKIFEPYFTTKHQSQGTGIGLHMTYNLIVNGMGGNIKVDNVSYQFNEKEYTGASFLIEIPLSS